MSKVMLSLASRCLASPAAPATSCLCRLAVSVPRGLFLATPGSPPWPRLKNRAPSTANTTDLPVEVLVLGDPLLADEAHGGAAATAAGHPVAPLLLEELEDTI